VVIDLEEREEGGVLPVKAHAGARRNEIGGVQNGMLKVAVTQAPEKGKANKAIIALLAKELSLRKAQIQLVAGETSAQKRFLVTGIPMADLRQRIARYGEV
jgi:hypothetical protein